MGYTYLLIICRESHNIVTSSFYQACTHASVKLVHQDYIIYRYPGVVLQLPYCVEPVQGHK